MELLSNYNDVINILHYAKYRLTSFVTATRKYAATFLLHPHRHTIVYFSTWFPHSLVYCSPYRVIRTRGSPQSHRCICGR